MEKDKLLLLLRTLAVLLISYVFCFVIYINYYGALSYKDFYLNLLVESTSIIVEFLILGFILNYFLEKNEIKSQIKKLKNEIDYVRYLKSDETKFKIFGIIKQLNELNETSLHLQNCNLSKLKEFSYINLENSKLHVTDFSYSILKSSNLNKTEGERTNFEFTKLSGSLIQNSIFLRCNFNNSISKSVNFKGSNFNNTTFISADLSGSKFINCTFNNCDFSKSKLIGADFKGSTFNQVLFNQADVKKVNFNDCNNFDKNIINTAINSSLIKKNN
jgi:fluoroquinolone resistance protein